MALALAQCLNRITSNINIGSSNISSSIFKQTQLTSTFSSPSRVQTRVRSFASASNAYTSKRPIPEAKNGLTTQTFLSSIGRDIISKLNLKTPPSSPSNSNSWSTLWTQPSRALKSQGLNTRDRRYLLWCMEKYRQGYAMSEFVHPPRPKKKIRGHGPAVQNGKRIRSRRRR